MSASEALTFLFTDIEGSTRLWEAVPESMGPAVARHDQILSSLVAQLGGQVFKSVGDGICAVFYEPKQALEAAVAMQHWIDAEPWPDQCKIRVRMGIHTGPAECRRGDYFGATLSLVSRLTNLGHGGQILVSAETRALILDRLPSDVGLSDMGFQRMRDIKGLHRVYQVVAPDLRAEFPPLRSAGGLPNNLPEQLSTFVGREKEMAELRRLLDSNRLLLLTGSGGCGKTRLAIQLASELLKEQEDGVWLVDLAHISDPDQVTDAVANAMRISMGAGSSLDTLKDHLQDKSMIIVLDNCEHVISGAAKLADTILRSCQGLKIIGSSRERLGVPGEVVFQVPPLSTPRAGDRLTPERLRRFESVQLFVERARAASGEFEITNQNSTALANLCARLDGIPLAIELAAARTRTMSVEQIESRLDDRFRLLTGGNRVALPRQQTLRALVDWSYDLLRESERTLLQRLSLFAGGWRLEQAESVCQDEQVESWEVLDLLGELYEKSMIVRETRNEGIVRYRLLETVRHYAGEKLLAAGGEEVDRLISAHADTYLALAETIAPKLIGSEAAASLDRLDEEHDNIRVALEGLIKNADASRSLRFVIALQRFWMTRGYLKEGWEFSSRALEHRAAAPVQLATLAMFPAAFCATNVGEIEAARSLFQGALESARQIGDKVQEGRALSGLAGIAGDYDLDYENSLKYNKAALEIHREAGNKLGQAAAYYNLADLTLRHDPRHRAHRSHEAIAEAKGYFESGLALFTELKDPKHQGICLYGLACVARESEAQSKGNPEFLAALEKFGLVGDSVWCGNIYKTFAEVALDAGRLEIAAILAGVGEGLHERARFVPPVTESQWWSGVMDRLRRSCSAERFQELLARGGDMDTEVTFALAAEVAGTAELAGAAARDALLR